MNQSDTTKSTGDSEQTTKATSLLEYLLFAAPMDILTTVSTQITHEYLKLQEQALARRRKPTGVEGNVRAADTRRRPQQDLPVQLAILTKLDRAWRELLMVGINNAQQQGDTLLEAHRLAENTFRVFLVGSLVSRRKFRQALNCNALFLHDLITSNHLTGVLPQIITVEQTERWKQLTSEQFFVFMSAAWPLIEACFRRSPSSSEGNTSHVDKVDQAISLASLCSISSTTLTSFRLIYANTIGFNNDPLVI